MNFWTGAVGSLGHTQHMCAHARAHTHTHAHAPGHVGKGSSLPGSPIPEGPGQQRAATSYSPQHSYMRPDFTRSGSPAWAGGRGAYQEGGWVPRWGRGTCPGSQNAG